MLKNIVLILFSSLLLFSCSNSKKISERVENYQENSLVIDAVTLYANGKTNEAENLFQNILAQDKDNATAMYYLSNIYMEKQDYDKAVDFGSKAIAIEENNLWFKIQLCEIYMAMQDYDNAAIMLEKIVKQEPQVIEYWQQLVLIYHVKQDIKGELSVLDRMEERFGITETTSLQKFQLYREQKNNKKAEQEIVKLSEAFPTQSKYLSILAEMKMKEKDYDKAFYYYNKVREINPEDENLNVTFANYYMVKQQEDSTFYYLNKAVAQKTLDSQSKIRIIYSVYGKNVDTDSLTFERFFSLLQTMETSGDTSDCTLYALLNTGYMRKGDFANAYICGRKSIEKGCNDYALFQNTLFAMGDFATPDEVIYMAQKAIDIYPEQPLPYLFKGINQEIKKEYSESINTLQTGVGVVGNDKTILEDLYMNIANSYYMLDNKEEAYKYYEKVLQINPNNISVLNNYAYYLSLDNKDLDKALEMAKKVISFEPEEITYIDTLAWILYMKGDYKQAKQVMDSIKLPKDEWDETYKEHYNQII
ncbi:MAG: tetratricopeptide repeat protein, partial [Bacteroidota bacterium]|nr:tetratricopeptide repeat protein [Bacteroidota bacterium]